MERVDRVERVERDYPREPIAVGGSPFIASDPVPSLTGVKDEYNPLRPNDYEEMSKKKKEQRQKEDDERKRDRDREEEDRNRWVQYVRVKESVDKE